MTSNLQRLKAIKVCFLLLLQVHQRLVGLLLHIMVFTPLRLRMTKQLPLGTLLVTMTKGKGKVTKPAQTLKASTQKWVCCLHLHFSGQHNGNRKAQDHTYCEGGEARYRVSGRQKRGTERFVNGLMTTTPADSVNPRAIGGLVFFILTIYPSQVAARLIIPRKLWSAHLW